MNTTSTNGTHTRTFTPTQGFVRVKYSASAAFSLANATLNMVDVDTVYTVLARGGYRYGFNSMEKDDELKGKGNSYDFGARMYDSRLGRWLTIDPLAMKYPDINPYNFVANTPLMAIDPDGRLIIFINGAVGKDSERGHPTYWSYKFISRMKNAFNDHKSGKYIDADLGMTTAWTRRTAGYKQAKADWNDIIAGLEKNADGKIVETIKIVSHSRGSAYGVGYAKKLRELREANLHLFAEDGGKVETHIMLAPHQSGSSAFDIEKSETTTISITHDYDPLSDGGANGNVLSIETDNNQWALEFKDTHTIDGFHGEAAAAAKKVTENKKNNELGTKGVKEAVENASKKQGNALYDRKTRTYKSN